MQYHGDYAGVAQAVLEKRHPGTTALFVTGCGADANPSPRGTVELVEAHGTALADAVDRALGAMTPVPPSLRTTFSTVDLPDVYLQRHAALMEAAIARDGRLPAAQPDPIQVWIVARPSPLFCRADGKPWQFSRAPLGGRSSVALTSRLSSCPQCCRASTP